MISRFRKRKNIVDRDQEEWIVEQFGWLERNLGLPARALPLVTPTGEFFTRPPPSGHARAEHIFKDVRRLMDMETWPCTLEAQEADVDPYVDEMLVLQDTVAGPLGTFDDKRAGKEKVVITYNPSELENIESLIATFAHELSHYRLSASTAPRPDDEDHEECLTDLLAIRLGFGLFLANSWFVFDPHAGPTGQGWQTSGGGYLTEREIVFALALFMRRNDHDISAARPYLKSHLYGLLKRAGRYLKSLPRA